MVSIPLNYVSVIVDILSALVGAVGISRDRPASLLTQLLNHLNASNELSNEQPLEQ